MKRRIHEGKVEILPEMWFKNDGINYLIVQR